MKNAEAEKEVREVILQIKNVTYGVMLVGFFALFLWALNMSEITRNLGAGSLIFGACFLIGTLIGFLFSLPKDNHSQQPQSTDKALKAGVKTNANLEQISDWLTKILVGVGLTQLNAIPSFLRKIATFLAPTFTSQDPTKVQGIVISIVLLGVVTGFLTAYLLTRLYLSKKFDIVEEELDDSSAIEIISIDPLDAKIHQGDKKSFTCNGLELKDIEWKVVEPNGGTINAATGEYTAPNIAGTYTVQVSSKTDPKKNAEAKVAVT